MRKSATDPLYSGFAMAAAGLGRRKPARAARLGAAILSTKALLILVYALLARVDVVATVEGRVIPSGRSKVIQPAEAGTVSRIRVRDGQSVKAGEIVVELVATAMAADRERARHELWNAQAEAARLHALLAGRRHMTIPEGVPIEVVAMQRAILESADAEQRARIASLDAEASRKAAERDGAADTVAHLTTSMRLVEQKYSMRREMADSGHLAEAAVLDTRLEMLAMRKEIAIQRHRVSEAAAALHAMRQQRRQVSADYIARYASALADAGRRQTAAGLDLAKLEQRLAAQTLRAPIDGVVQQLAVATVGGVVTPAQAIAIVVPADAALEIEAQVLNRDIGYISAGQRLVAKVETYDFTRFGVVEGVVQWIGADALEDARRGLVYPVRILLDQGVTPRRVDGRVGRLRAGMNVTADIHVGERRLISYFFSPLLRYSSEALRER